MIAYLSSAWIDALAEAVAGDADVRAAAAGVDLTISVVVGDDAYHLVAAGGSVRVGAGAADRSDLVLRQDRPTAVAVATGALNPQRALLDGRIVLDGRADRFVSARALLEAIERAAAPVRARTDHA